MLLPTFALDELIDLLHQEVESAVLLVDSFLDSVKDVGQLLKLRVFLLLDVVAVEHLEFFLEIFLRIRQVLVLVVPLQECRQLWTRPALTDVFDDRNCDVFEGVQEHF